MNYGTIPTSSSSSNPHAPASLSPRAASLRPWAHFFNPHSLSKPYSYPETLTRVKSNLHYFRFNYSLILLILLFLTLIYHPLSMILFLSVFVLWFYFYFFRDGPVVVFHRTVDDRVVFCVMGFVTVLVLVLTHVGVNVLIGLIVGVVLIGLHAAFRVSDDSFVEEDDFGEGGLVSVVASSAANKSTFG